MNPEEDPVTRWCRRVLMVCASASVSLFCLAVAALAVFAVWRLVTL